MKTPSEWEELYGIRILDPDGWRKVGDPSWDTPIDREDWESRMGISTITIEDPDKYHSQRT